MENKKENEIKETAQENVQNVITEEHELKLYVEREKFTSNGEQYWAYVLNGKVRGRDVKVDFIPKDKGGYEPLDIVFSIADTAELVMTTETMIDAVGKKMSYITYKVINKDDLGILECGVKPSRDSDKALLNMIISELKACADK